MSTAPTWPGLLARLLEGEDLSIFEASWAMRRVMEGEATPAQLAGFLVALRAKGETVDEFVGFRDAALEHRPQLPAGLAPLGPEVDHHRHCVRALDHGCREACLGHVHAAEILPTEKSIRTRRCTSTRCCATA